MPLQSPARKSVPFIREWVLHHTRHYLALWLALLHVLIALLFGQGPTNFELGLRRYMSKAEASVGVRVGSLRAIRSDEIWGGTPSSLSHWRSPSAVTDYDETIAGPRLTTSDPYAPSSGWRGWFMPTSWPYGFGLNAARTVALSYALLQGLCLAGAFWIAWLLTRQLWLANLAGLLVGYSLFAQTWLTSGIGYCVAALGFALSALCLLLHHKTLVAAGGALLLFWSGGVMLFAGYPPATLSSAACGLIVLPLIWRTRRVTRGIGVRVALGLFALLCVMVLWWQDSRPLLTALSHLALADRHYPGAVASFASLVHEWLPGAAFTGSESGALTNLCEDSRIAFWPVLVIAALSLGQRVPRALLLSFGLLSILACRVYFGAFDGFFAMTQLDRVSSTRLMLGFGYAGALCSLCLLRAASESSRETSRLTLMFAVLVFLLPLWIVAHDGTFSTVAGAPFVVFWWVAAMAWLQKRAWKKDALLLAMSAQAFCGFMFNPILSIAAVDHPPQRIQRLREHVGEGALLELNGPGGGNVMPALGVPVVLGWHPLGAPELLASLRSLTRDQGLANGYCYFEGAFGEHTWSPVSDRSVFDINPCDPRWAWFGVNVLTIDDTQLSKFACQTDWTDAELPLTKGQRTFVSKESRVRQPLLGATLLEAQPGLRRYQQEGVQLTQALRYERRALLIHVRADGAVRTPVEQLLMWDSQFIVGVQLNGVPVNWEQDSKIPLAKRISLRACLSTQAGCQLRIDLL